ncbi:MAG: hypothetical protein PHX16_04570 [Syntrophaceticus sp.]|nr:hypothetical protein [Syntrophaceticus sp.]HBG23148.1 hypothetical protein [Peptococcaceae bacterium]MDD3314567.1 hypothetical protein [Syntrophaceticus sp.]MDD4359787.1 hypothetical protein [Syntrophaceticus sp.]MDD4782898.1 hypothetical protein [Syntrophaceticus sp.]
MAERTCHVCALAQEMEPEGVYFCYKHKRVKAPNETGWDWGCLYFCEAAPEENLSPYQYLLIEEADLSIRK